jgi:hypothetical protein
VETSKSKRNLTLTQLFYQSKEKGSNISVRETFIEVNMTQTNLMVKVTTFGRTKMNILVNFTREPDRAKDNGQVPKENPISVNSKTIKKVVLEFTDGITVTFMRVNSKKTKEMVMERWLSSKKKLFRGFGREESNKTREIILILAVCLRKVWWSKDRNQKNNKNLVLWRLKIKVIQNKIL